MDSTLTTIFMVFGVIGIICTCMYCCTCLFGLWMPFPRVIIVRRNEEVLERLIDDEIYDRQHNDNHTRVAVLRTIPKTMLNEDAKNSDCPICLVDLDSALLSNEEDFNHSNDDSFISNQRRKQQDVVSLNCGHLFHQECVTRWIHTSQNALCPMCNHPI